MNKINPTAIIGKNTLIGNNVTIGAFVVIEENVVIGNNVILKAFCELRSGCKIGNNVSFGSRCTLANNTIVENGVIIKYGFVATDTPKIGQIKRQPCILKNNSKFGANVTIMPGIIIGKNSEIGACSQVRHNIPENEIWYGNPAKFFKNKKD
jgi:UDP-2-acetamido-3-amino-2,3-dideoxy-glucuronate N-acetyltransferase